MESFLLFVVLVVLLIRWWILSERYAEMKQRIETLSRDRVEPANMVGLLQRVYKLEEALAGLKGKRGGVVEEAAPEPELVRLVVPKPPAPEPVCEPVAAKPPTVAAPEQQPCPSRSSEEWEAVVGGNWLNKLGIFVLVIAIALFLGYSFTQLGPAGRSSIGLAVSVTLLSGGVVLERRAPYVIFARGLLGGGWAGLYFTVYAMQAVEAAKVIHNPLLGGFLLLAVAAGMVAHSMRYHVQALTGLAYSVAFTTLAITQVTTLSVIALIPLAGSLLVVAYRFRWSGMALFGLAATYATCAYTGDSGAPLWVAQTVFATYWLMFEAYDLMRARRRSNDDAEKAILPLNALSFACLSYAKWLATAPADVYLLASGLAAAYLAATILRAVARPPSSFPAEAGTLERIFAGGYEGPITLAAVCSAAAVVLKLHAQTLNIVLLAEGELLFLAGLFFCQGYPRRLAATLFAALGLKLLCTDIPGAGTVQVAGHAFQDWTPPAALAALLFFVNRGLRKSGIGYGYAAFALAALIIGFEIPLRYLGIAWLGFGALLFVFGWQFRLFDFRSQGYMAAVLALSAITIFQAEVAYGTAQPWAYPWISLAIAGAVGYGAVLCARHPAANRLADLERQALEFSAGATATAAFAALLWRTVPAGYLGPAWMALALVALELGLRRRPPEFRRHACLLASLGAARVLCFTVLPFHPIARIEERIAIGCAALLAYAFAARMFAARPESRRAVNVASACGSFFVLIELWALLDAVIVAPAWALFALALIGLGFRANLAGLRLQGHAVAAAAFGRLFYGNFEAGGHLFGMSHRLLTVGVVIAAHYHESRRQHRTRGRLTEWELPLYRAYLYTAAGLVAGLFYLELLPQFIEAGWALLMLALLAAGRMMDVRDLRYQSYTLAAMTFWRAAALEFSSSQVFADTEERIAVGALVTACLFVAQLAVPRAQAKPGLEQGARLLYSLLSTALATALLFEEVSGSMLTVAWGIEGAALLVFGFALRDRTLRLSGLALFLVCVGKLFLSDLRELETLYRILSFFVLGVILVGVSWLYTRFRDQIQRYL